MKILATYSTFLPAILAVLKTTPDPSGLDSFEVVAAVPNSTDLPKGTIAVYSIEDSTCDVAVVPVTPETYPNAADVGLKLYYVIEYGN